jgi:hypothetical protein
VAKQRNPDTLDHDFVFSSDADLDARIAAFRSEHEATHRQRLAMHARRSLGPGKVRVTFRVVEDRGKRGR